MSRHKTVLSNRHKNDEIEHRWIILLLMELLIAAVLIAIIAAINTEVFKKEATPELSEKFSDSCMVVRNVSFEAAEKAVKGHIVFIETGHGIDEKGDWDTGCTWSDGTTEFTEAKIMIPIAQAMARYLRRSGITVITDADSGNDQNLFAALDYMEKHQVDAFVNLHCDWENADSGTMPLYKTDEQKALGLALSKGVHEYIAIPDRGPQYREDLDTLNSDKPKCPASLFETGCIKSDNKILTTQYDEYGKGLAKGMCYFLNVKFIED